MIRLEYLYSILSFSLFCNISYAEVKQKKNESIRIKYELTHNICEKNKCENHLISADEAYLELEKESDKFFWKYKPISISKELFTVTIRLKASLSYSPQIKRSLEVGFSEKLNSTQKQVAWGEMVTQSDSWPKGLSVRLIGNEYQIDKKTIFPSVKISF